MTHINQILISTLFCSSLFIADANALNNQDAFSSVIGGMMESDNELKNTINLAGKQRMLTQRMSKAALLVSLGIESKKYREKLNSFAELYNKTLKGLKSGDAELKLSATDNSDVLKEIDIVEKHWSPFYEQIKEIAAKGVKAKSAIDYIINNNEVLLASSDDLVTAFEKSNTSMDYLTKFRLRVVNIAGRQRMLTQKMTKEKLLVSELKKSEYADKLKKSIALFDTSLTALIHGDAEKGISKPTDAVLIKAYAKVEKGWTKLKPLYSKKSLDNEELQVIVNENPKLLKDMNNAVNLAESALEY